MHVPADEPQQEKQEETPEYRPLYYYPRLQGAQFVSTMSMNIHQVAVGDIKGGNEESQTHIRIPESISEALDRPINILHAIPLRELHRTV